MTKNPHKELATPQRLQLVLGMHRSGTSAVAGHLCAQGFTAPHDLPPADANNPTGYWEPRSILRLHNKLLAEAQSSWDDPFLPANALQGADTAAGQARLEKALSDAFPPEADGSGVALVKDPRQCRWLPLWNPFIESRGIDTAALLVHRHPMAVVKSIRRREQLPADRILLLWLQHTLEAECHSRCFRRVIVSYEQFLKNPAATVSAVQALWPEVDFAANNVDNAVTVEVRPDLNHADDPFDGSAPRVNGTLLQLALDVHQTLAASQEPDIQHLDHARQALHDHLDSVTQQLARMVTLQLFWEPIGGKGFTEANSIRQSMALSRQSVVVTLNFVAPAEGVQRLRFDPAETPCLVHFAHVWLRDENNDLLWQWPDPAQQDASNSTLPLAAVNNSTELFGHNRSPADCISLISQSQDPALLIRPQNGSLLKLKGNCRLVIQAKWEPLSVELSSLLASLAREPSH